MDNFCVICGEIIPEGRIVCPICEKTVIDQSHKRGGFGFGSPEKDVDSEKSEKSIPKRTSWMKHGS